MNKKNTIAYLLLSCICLAALLPVMAHATSVSERRTPGEPVIVTCRVLDAARGTVLEEPMTVTSNAMRNACERGAAVFIVPDIEIETVSGPSPQPWENQDREVRD